MTNFLNLIVQLLFLLHPLMLNRVLYNSPSVSIGRIWL